MTTELDKFKRRVIRSVARVIRQGGQDKQADDLMWENLQKEVGCDCKLLWERMRTLTLKKMKRLLPAEDRLRSIAEVAQMQLTDWLLFDLVLVHEDIDVITDDPKSKPMKELLNLVQMFEIEGKNGGALTTAWTAATFYYNSFGRQCSPMLLQRRWYQLKKTTRAKFYSFWYEYRGNQRLLEAAKKSMPNNLHSSIAQIYPYVITKPFKDWQELIEEKFVILPEEFEAKMRSKNMIEKSEKSEPDIVLVEPQIETIDLGVDSDGENDAKNSEKDDADKDKDILPTVTIKKEIENNDEIDLDEDSEADIPQINKDDTNLPVKTNVEEKQDGITEEEGNDNVEAAENATNMDITEIDNDEIINQTNDGVIALEDDEFVNNNGDVIKQEITADDDVHNDDTNDNNEHTDVADVDVNKEQTDDAELNTTGIVNREIFMPQIMNVFGNVKLAAAPLKTSLEISEAHVSEPMATEIEEVIRLKALEYTSSGVEESQQNHDAVNVNETPPIKVETPKTDIKLKCTEDIVNQDNPSGFNAFEDIPPDLTFEDDGIELVDDGIEFDDEDDDMGNKSDQSSADKNCDVPSEQSPKFDLKLLMQPIVYTTKLDNMSVFKDRNVTSLKDNPSINAVLVESKPSLPDPKPKSEIEDEPPQLEEDAQPTSDSEDERTPEISRVKLSSYLLRKPRRRSYNPIQVCKNPDFNTRLKRLTVGFLSSTRNRSLLRSLKPMTIDVSKAFEGKLVDGTMYLTSDSSPMKVKREKVEEPANKQATAVLPLAMPVQSLIDNVSMNIRDIIPVQRPLDSKPDLILNERQKTINLPDISNIRRINQQLLTAEVTPMRIGAPNDKCVPPIQLVPSHNKESQNVPVKKEEDTKIDASPTVLDELPATQRPPILTEMACKDILEKNKVLDEISPLKNKKSTEAETKTTNVAPLSTSTKPTTLNKQKKNSFTEKPSKITPYRMLPQAQPLTWDKPQPSSINYNYFGDSLLTVDTLQKMLNVCNHGDSEINKMKPRQIKKLLKKKNQNLQQKTEQYEDNKSDGNQKEIVDDTNVDDQQTTEEPRVRDKGMQTTKKPKTNVVKAKSYGDYCCWARLKLCYMNPSDKFRIGKHRCPRLCRCCCRDELAEKIKLKRKQNPTEIVISDDEDSKKISATIDHVIKKTKNRVDTGTEVSTQCDLESKRTSDDDCISSTSPNNVSEIAAASISIIPPKYCTRSRSRPVVRIVKKTKYSTRIALLEDTANKINVPPLNRDMINKNIGSGRQENLSNVLDDLVQKMGSNLQGHIIIDGTKKLTVHNKNFITTTNYDKLDKTDLKEKILLLKKSVTKEVKSPIYIGKNKILLTDVKFPANDSVPKDPVTTPPQQQAQPVAVLPFGVQLMLLPNGVVTYTLGVGVELTDEDKARIPGILAMVQKQLDASGAMPLNKDAPAEIVNLTQDDDAETATTDSTGVVSATQNINNQTPQIENIETNRIETSTVSLEKSVSENISPSQSVSTDVTEITDQTSSCQTINTNITSDDTGESDPSLKAKNKTNSQDSVALEGVKDSATVSQSQSSDLSSDTENPQGTVASDNKQENVTNQTEPLSVPANENRKSLLSDLMEMSGIWDDIDTNVPAPNESTVQTTNASLPLVLSATTLPTEEMVPMKVTSEPTATEELSKEPALGPVTQPSNDLNVHELTPISTFVQLKYACEQNGKFFKLDLDTGVLSCGIKVCIKKQLPKSVIDLTADDDDEAHVKITQEPNDSPSKGPISYSLSNNTRSLIKTNSMPADSVKPLRLFKSVRILKRNKEHTVLLPAPEASTPSPFSILRRRKQEMTNAIRKEAKWPVEVLDDDSLDSLEYVYRDSDFLDTSSESDDSSDDEPLAAKAKRMRTSEVNSGDDDKVMEHDGVDADVTAKEAESGDKLEHGQNDEEKIAEKSNNAIDKDIQGQNETAKDDESGSVEMAFMPDDIEGDDDDCILGF